VTQGFLDLLLTKSVRAAQVAYLGREVWKPSTRNPSADRFTDKEVAFIAARDSFYLATISESGWPYVQHRGGPIGFARVIDETTFAFPDYVGNRQYISLGNSSANDRVSIFMMDYPNRVRLKLLATMQAHDVAEVPQIAARLGVNTPRSRAERIFVLKLKAFDWNCAQYIHPRYTVDDIETAVSQMRDKIAVLEKENAALRAKASAT